jgi:3-hydroxyisobutyrate dehydrogenase
MSLALPPSHVALIGFGEVGSILARDLKAKGVARLTAYVPKFNDPDSPPSKALAEGTAIAAASAAEAATGASLVISAVTAAQAVAAAEAAAPGMGQGARFLDLNSASPGAKREAGRAIEAGRGIYVEAAVMTPFPPYGIASPMLLGGPHAEAFLPTAEALGMKVRIASTDVGVASATKMCRSVMIKGIEALIAESLITARRNGVDAAVLASLNDLLPNPDWPKLARYMISRSLIHGKRRAEEMREAARTVEEAGLVPHMARATVERQEWAQAQRARLPKAVVDGEDLDALLDALISD